MPRPRICRRIFFEPHVTFFKPSGVSLRHLDENILTKDELEAVRLIDLEQMPQDKAAKKMKISQPTLSRLLKSGRKKLADAIVKGKAIKIKGGDYEMAVPRRGIGRGQGFRRPAGGRAAGPAGQCVCPKCGYTIPHQIGVPCYKLKCPKCGAKMSR